MAYDKNNPKHKWLREYLRDVADKLGLRDWTLILSPDCPEHSDADASTYCTEGRKHATFWISENFWEEDPEEQRATVVHELLHCHFAAPHRWAMDREDKTGKDAFRLLSEYSIDGLADAISQWLPLPTSAEKKKK